MGDSHHFYINRHASSTGGDADVFTGLLSRSSQVISCMFHCLGTSMPTFAASRNTPQYGILSHVVVILIVLITMGLGDWSHFLFFQLAADCRPHLTPPTHFALPDPQKFSACS